MRITVGAMLLGAMGLANSVAVASEEPAPASVASVEAAPDAPPKRHYNPRLKASYRLFSLAGLDGKPMWLQGAQMDAYWLSRRWVRAGIELEGGVGSTNFAGAPTSLSYGLLGLSAGFQYPARVTPFVEGRFAAGVLSGELRSALTVGNSAYAGAATTYTYGGGIEGGVEVYIAGRSYLSAGVGWMRATWHGIDVAQTAANPDAGIAYKDLHNDTFTLKVGVGI